MTLSVSCWLKDMRKFRKFLAKLHHVQTLFVTLTNYEVISFCIVGNTLYGR